LYKKLFPCHRYDILPAGLRNCMACAKNNSWTETVWGTREFLEIYEIGVFQEKKMAGEVSVLKLLEPQKVLGLEMALKPR